MHVLIYYYMIDSTEKDEQDEHESTLKRVVMIILDMYQATRLMGHQDHIGFPFIFKCSRLLAFHQIDRIQILGLSEV